MTGYPAGDNEYRDLTVIDVSDRHVTTSDGWSFGGYGGPQGWVPRPRIGDDVRMYGSFGHPVRGLFVRGQCVFYRTLVEQRAKEQSEIAEQHAADKAQFERDRASMDARFEALPDEFRRRILRFRAGNPDFRWRFESYELFCCEEAMKVLTEAPLSDQHSGNTEGFARYLARLYAEQPEAVVTAHGALVPLVGCEAYGCTHEAAKGGGKR